MMMMISESTRKKCYGSTVWELHCLRTALCESIRYQAKSEQNVRQDSYQEFFWETVTV